MSTDSPDNFTVLPYDDPTGNDGFNLLNTEYDARAFEVELSDLEDRLPEDPRVDSHENPLLAHSDAATTATSRVASDASSDDSLMVELDREMDLLAGHRVIILYGCSITNILDDLPSAIVRECALLRALHNT